MDQTLFERRVRLIVPLFLCVLFGVALGQEIFQQRVASYGTIKVIGVSVFGDKACTSRVSSIVWGLITPGTSVNKYLYVLNDGTATATLSMSYGNWTPAVAASYFVFAWNCSNYALSRNGVICAKFTLTVRANVTGVRDFSFMILIQAAG